MEIFKMSKCRLWEPAIKLFDSKSLQLSQSSPANFGGSYFGQNMTKKNILATSVLLNYPKVCPLTKKFTFRVTRKTTKSP